MLFSIEAKASQIEDPVGYTFTNKCLAAEAVQMAAPEIAVIHNDAFTFLNNNKRLAVLGDAILAKILCAAWFKARDPQGKEHILHLRLTGTDTARKSSFSGTVDRATQWFAQQ
jgi:dsRNA-specific ribonuclease